MRPTAEAAAAPVTKMGRGSGSVHRLASVQDGLVVSVHDNKTHETRHHTSPASSTYRSQPSSLVLFFTYFSRRKKKGADRIGRREWNGVVVEVMRLPVVVEVGG